MIPATALEAALREAAVPALGTVCIDGIARAGTQDVFLLRYIQARDPRLIGEPFFAAFDPGAAWFTDLRPAPGLPAMPAAAETA